VASRTRSDVLWKRKRVTREEIVALLARGD
jgi:hypothetical protein